jgi:predicted dithiol-disulfide oxidoreductase (DUF899 family)
MTSHRIVSREQWIEARKALLEKEKALTRARDALMEERRALPWVRIEKVYAFDAPQGKVSLADLFDGRSQLFIQHFMFAPDWQEGCVGCSFGADHVDAARRHFEHNDLSFAAVSRAPIDKIEDFRKRMGWAFRWVSSAANDFNYDFNVSFRPEEIAAGEATYNFSKGKIDGEEAPGASVFVKDETGAIFHSWSGYGRGDEGTLGAYMFLDMTPKGRNENGPHYNLMDWVRHHDRYGADGRTDSRLDPAQGAGACCTAK